jgi:hypothetical protein
MGKIEDSSILIIFGMVIPFRMPYTEYFQRINYMSIFAFQILQLVMAFRITWVLGIADHWELMILGD